MDIDPTATPFHSKAYAVPFIHHQVFKDELKRLIDIDVLERTGASLWAAPSFIIPKKDNRVRWITDFHVLNKAIRHQKYPLPRIKDIINRPNGYNFFCQN